MLQDLLTLYLYAVQSGDEQCIDRALKDLESVGMDKYTADMLIEDMM